MYHFFNTCVGWDPEDVDVPGGLSDMIHEESTCLTRRTFLKHVDREELAELEKGCGYEAHPSQGLTMAGDWHVSYHRSRLHGKRVYFFKWSGIEYVFRPVGRNGNFL